MANASDTPAWVHEAWNGVVHKLRHTADKVGESLFPYSTENGQFVNRWDTSLHDWWTNGFWPGMLWKMYEATGEAPFRSHAEALEEMLDPALENFDTLHHDVGFMWLLTSVAHYRVTGDAHAKRRGLHAAAILASRFNPAGNFIRAWNGDGKEGWAIIDCLMNIPLLYWASQETGDERYRTIAMRHADTILQYGLRPDGSVKHIVEFDPVSGAYIKNHTGQGYSEESSWTRGQAWGLYGFALSALHTGKQTYLDASKRVAHYFIAALGDDPVPPADFRAPAEPAYKDTTAGLIAACGLLALADLVPPGEQEMYRQAALRIVRATVERYCDFTLEEDSIVQFGTEAYHNSGKNIPIIYGDYYLVEALARIQGIDRLYW